jgi:hypothetical protein
MIFLGTRAQLIPALRVPTCGTFVEVSMGKCCTKSRAGLALALMVMMLGCAGMAAASATLFLEEPYGRMGWFTATGHAAIYLSDVCADSPTVLRRCAPGETGVVISRYDGVDGYDWLAIPLIPYLYAVDRVEDVPLFANAKMVFALRDEYRRQHLEAVAPDGVNGEAPKGTWYELVGASYDRAIYGFEIATTPEQDDALIEKLNSSPNHSHFHLVSNNCADFAKQILNFYYPESVRRSFVADVGITTPKQLAKMLTKFNKKHEELGLSRYVIAQVPGSMPRSSTPHGVVESFLSSKKYIVPTAVVSPIFAGCVFAVYVATGGSHNPGRNALVFNAGGDEEAPLSKAERKGYQRKLKSLLAESGAGSPRRASKDWEKAESRARLRFDDQGGPMLQLEVGGRLVRVGATAENVMEENAPPPLVREMLAARLQSELRGAAAREVSASQIARDWSLLQRAERADGESGSGAMAMRTSWQGSSVGNPAGGGNGAVPMQTSLQGSAAGSNR